MCGYALWRKHQCDYEEEQWRTAGLEERERRIQQRKEYLFARFVGQQHLAQDVVECPNCTPGLLLEVHAWPSWYCCLNCNHVCVVDENSHLMRGGGEFVFIEKLEGLASKYSHYDRGAM